MNRPTCRVVCEACGETLRGLVELYDGPLGPRVRQVPGTGAKTLNGRPPLGFQVPGTKPDDYLEIIQQTPEPPLEWWCGGKHGPDGRRRRHIQRNPAKLVEPFRRAVRVGADLPV